MGEIMGFSDAGGLLRFVDCMEGDRLVINVLFGVLQLFEEDALARSISDSP
jgi:hypothetical protein